MSRNVLAVMDDAAVALMDSGNLDAWEEMVRARGVVAELMREAGVAEEAIRMIGLTCKPLSSAIADARGAA